MQPSIWHGLLLLLRAFPRGICLAMQALLKKVCTPGISPSSSGESFRVILLAGRSYAFNKLPDSPSAHIHHTRKTRNIPRACPEGIKSNKPRIYLPRSLLEEVGLKRELQHTPPTKRKTRAQGMPCVQSLLRLSIVFSTFSRRLPKGLSNSCTTREDCRPARPSTKSFELLGSIAAVWAPCLSAMMVVLRVARPNEYIACSDATTPHPSAGCGLHQCSTAARGTSA